MTKAWLARFGRTVADQVLDGVRGRLAAPERRAGFAGRLAGEALPSWSAGTDEADGAAEGATDGRALHGTGERDAAAALGRWMAGADGREAFGSRDAGSRAVTGRELLTGTSFALTGETAEGGTVALWGLGAVSGFEGHAGALQLDGEVTTGLLGTDWARGRWLGGLAVAHSAGNGKWRDGGGASGYGKGRLPLTPDGGGGGAAGRADAVDGGGGGARRAAGAARRGGGRPGAGAPDRRGGGDDPGAPRAGGLVAVRARERGCGDAVAGGRAAP